MLYTEVSLNRTLLTNFLFLSFNQQGVISVYVM